MASINLTEREMDVLKAVVEVMKADIDFSKVAELANMNTAKYARDKWAQGRNKIIAPATSKTGEADDSNGTPKAKKPTSRNRSGAISEGEATPAAKKKKTPPGKGKGTSSPAENGDDEEDKPKVKDEPNKAGEMMDDLAD